jgi:uncharacterized protein YuzE
MTIRYYSDVDILTIRLNEARIRASDEVEPGLIVDFGFDDRVVGLEILRASKNIPNLSTVELENLSPAAVIS